MIDGWVLACRGGGEAISSINAFYRSQRPFEQNLADARSAMRPLVCPRIRMTPFIDDPSLDRRLDSLGYVHFDQAIVMALDLDHLHCERAGPFATHHRRQRKQSGAGG